MLISSARASGKVLVVAGVLCSFRVTRAQDALESAISLAPLISRNQSTPVDLRPDVPHLGPVRLTLGGYAGLELNDNVNLSQIDPKQDLLLRGGLQLGVFWPVTVQSELRFSSNLGYVHYLENSQYDHLEVAPNSALAWVVGFGDGSITLFDQFSYSQQVLAESAISGQATFPRFNNTIGARVDWLPGRWALEAGYSHNDSFSDSDQFQYLNSSSEYFFARGAWRLAERTQAGLEASSSFTSYQLASQTGNFSISLGPYIDWQITDSIRVSLRGGPVFYTFDSSPGPSQAKSLDAYYVGLDFRQSLTDFLSHRLMVQRDVRQGINQGSSYIEELTTSYSVTCALTQKISLGASFTYEQGTQPLEIPVVLPFGVFLVQSIENYERYGASLNATWQTTEKFGATLSFSHWLRDSNLPNNVYTVNSLSLSLNYTF